jgi:hypothetical protein
MALSDLSFKFYTDSGLTSAFSGLYQLTHQTDQSDNPQDFTLYFGSPLTGASSTELQAVSNPGVDQITLTPTDIEGAWVANTAYSLGDIIEPTSPNTYVYKVTTAGTSAAVTEPSWPTSINSTVVDGTIIWTCYAKVHDKTEIKLALSSGGLPGATAGALLNLGTTITSGPSNAVAVYIRLTNAVLTVNTNTGFPQLGININNVEEVSI